MKLKNLIVKLLIILKIFIPKNNLPPELVISPKLRDPEFRTFYLILLNASNQQTLSTTIEALATQRHLTPRTIHYHLNRLKNLQLINFSTADGSQVKIFILPVKNFNDPGHVANVVIVTDSTEQDKQQQQQQHDNNVEPEKNFRNPEKILQGMAAVFTADGRTPNSALRVAQDLLNLYGPAACSQQLTWFPRRCELLGDKLKNPSGVLISSIRNNWSPPASPRPASPKSWYTEEEFNQLIDH